MEMGIKRGIMSIDTTKKCFKYFDGAARLTIKNMHTSEMKELVEILIKEIKFREDIGKEIEDARTHKGGRNEN